MYAIFNALAGAVENRETTQLRRNIKFTAELGQLISSASTATFVAFGIFFLGNGGFFGLMGFLGAGSLAFLSYDSYLMCKSLSHISDQPMYFIGFEIHSQQAAQQAIRDILIELGNQTYIMGRILNAIVLCIES